MALSYRDRVGRGFEQLAGGLGPWADGLMTAKTPAGMNWLEIWIARDSAKFGVQRDQSITDPAFVLRVIVTDWQVFKSYLSRGQQAFASELIEARNAWAHNKPFAHDDAYRALDTMERLLTAAGAVEHAEAVRVERVDMQRDSFEKETRNKKRRIEATEVAAVGVKPWREIITPHPDVAQGLYKSAEFAADLTLVSKGQASDEYLDPVQFFRRTYLTEGLKDLVSRAARRLSGDTNASPVVNLQTNFGGGKTHSMLALYHLASGTPVSSYPQEVQDAVGEVVVPNVVNRVTLVGNHLSPSVASEKPDGTVVRTLWGELAWQLGGAAAYARIADADRDGTNPGQALTEVIRDHTPCLILIDEWVAYARQLLGREDKIAGGDFETQFTFAQSLTEAVKAIPAAMLVISIPASHGRDGEEQPADNAEVGGTHGQEALKRLQNVVRRIADQWRPATSEESFEIVRRRLFEQPDAAAWGEISLVARQFRDYYLQHKGEFPTACTEVSYEQRIKSCYPLHPVLFDLLYEHWSTLERFQRTRGVLRLMSAVVHELWMSQDALPLIMPGSVPLDDANVLTELTQYLPDAWKPIIDADVDGDSSTPLQVDRERPAFGQRGLTRRLARTVFMGSAPTLGSAHKGIERQNLYLGVAVPGDVTGNFGSALDLLGQRATYLYVDTGRYWYDTQASVTRTAQDYAERLREHPENVWVEIVRRLRESEEWFRGDFAGLHLAPLDTGDVNDNETARLVVLHPSFTHGKGRDDSTAQSFAARCLDTRGSAQRVNRNMLVFLAADDKRMEELAAAVRDYLAWTSVWERRVELNLTAQQASQAESRRKAADQTSTDRLRETYHWGLVPEQLEADRPVGLTELKVDGGQEHLADRVSAKLRAKDLLTCTLGARNIRMELNGPLKRVWERGHIGVGELWSYYLRYPYLTRVRDRPVLEEAVRSVLNELTWDVEGFALAEGFDETDGTYQGLAVPHENNFGQISDGTLLVAPKLARDQRERERADADLTTQVPGPTLAPGPGPGPQPPGPDAKTATRFFGVYRVDAERYSKGFAQLSQEVLQQLAALDGVDLEISVEIHAHRAGGFPDDKVRVVLENARTLKFEQSQFEAE